MNSEFPTFPSCLISIFLVTIVVVILMPPQPGPDLRAQTAAPKVVIVLNNEESIFVKDLHIENDTTSYVSVNNNEFNTINTSRIHFIEFRDATTGAIGGLTIGIISGLAVALVSIVLFMNEEGGHPNTGPLVALIYGPILGGVIGTITGAIREDRKIFTINTEK